ncbi:glutamine-hydrolyzing carbamoyl-phosphate synthase small subunit [Akkermansiaceae bacterium]|nr:glutamine-hydrolyzing carbamoyl-phosphate synthase small subunit [Akkermansiaceae bacterium]MDB4406980.1 glutamine-hydrolyzing carbamoyl-phosphate synthase small subunit [bacterium]MDA8968932.1 glutamine-hydrolyzing carbamoyl-phosphate synthase small subunit [Akkermansiaceae bacterium]MDB4273089.1 glutamine-hydrolyzing carbamoyl-phosphate synthase small subunit [Akkermansiaceae bacterium]MDB4373703.1 glutamine-hydrolyzing carbamoyl-phosphate synthase small subunit [Akkermansiaceae bacterium]
MTNAILALEDGRIFRGRAFGHSGTTTGEICFNTSMTGYQEIITDPSYRGQIVTMTYPLQGNYGVNPEDAESASPHVRGFVIGELCEVPSSWRSHQSLAEYFTEHQIIGIEEIDTRALTKHLRSAGAMRAVITTELSDEDAIQAAKDSTPMEGSDFVKEVSTEKDYLWEGESRLWTIPSVTTNQETNYIELPPVKYRIVAYDFGIKWNILRSLRQSGFEVEVVNARTPASEVLTKNPDGVFLSNGPGDPAALSYIHDEVKQIIGKKPVFGICLGHQILTHCYGGTTYKLKFGHRGGNHPVKDLRDGSVAITAQNHGFATDDKSLPDYVEVTHMNLNDNTVEGMRSTKDPVFSVQHHPEAAPGPNDDKGFFDEFVALIESSK